ncbi:DUF1127 domain-containing protein [Saccharospirillum mangrovi]|uniref:DUF1127 domain-containing protein n=1 Tax=Saccharospirillum mangrovi TaxID=2161747 RepID=UPI0018E4E26A|nr:DUF1127 domain-containing protein [Saccharospirillum mangrovi]
MSTQLNANSTGLSRFIDAAIGHLKQGMAELADAWRIRRRTLKTRRRLSQLPAYMYRDLGLRPDEVQREINRGLWH